MTDDSDDPYPGLYRDPGPLSPSEFLDYIQASRGNEAVSTVVAQGITVSEVLEVLKLAVVIFGVAPVGLEKTAARIAGQLRNRV